MIHLQRKLKARFNGSVDFLPEGVPKDKFLPVIGYEVRRREYKKESNSKPEIREDVYYLITTKGGKLIPIASFNMQTQIDETAEIDLRMAIELLRNATLIGKRLCELFDEKPSNHCLDGDKGKA